VWGWKAGNFTRCPRAGSRPWAQLRVSAPACAIFPFVQLAHMWFIYVPSPSCTRGATTSSLLPSRPCGGTAVALVRPSSAAALVRPSNGQRIPGLVTICPLELVNRSKAAHRNWRPQATRTQCLVEQVFTILTSNPVALASHA
jgi:hypothetical protein